jgi:hypothetical protein
MRLKQVMPRQTQEKLPRPAAARQSPWQLEPSQARLKPGKNMPCDSGGRGRGKLWKTVETNCSEAIAVAARANQTRRLGMRLGQVRPKQIWQTQPRPAAARQSEWQLEPTRARMKPRHAGRGAEANSRKQLRPAATRQSRRQLGLTQAKEMRCLEKVTTKAARPFPSSWDTCTETRSSEAEAKKTVETSCSEAIAVASRTSLSEAEAKQNMP